MRDQPSRIAEWLSVAEGVVARMQRQRNAGAAVPDYACAPSGLQEQPSSTRASCPLLAPLFHIGARHCIHAPLIAGPFLLEIIEYVLVDADRDRSLFGRDYEDGLGPVHIERARSLWITRTSRGSAALAPRRPIFPGVKD